MNPRRWAPPLAWAAAILVVTSIPGAELAPVAPFSFPGADKLVHATLYGVLGWLVARAHGAAQASQRDIVIMLACIALFAAADEWHQTYIPGRSTEPLDWLADSLGATCGVAAFAVRRRQEVL